MSIRGALSLAAALWVLGAPLAHAQSGVAAGHWSGVINEPRSESFPAYTLSVHLGLDQSGRVVGLAQYDAFPCAGVWTLVETRGMTLRLHETIVDGIERCAEHVIVELTLRGDGYDVRLWPVGGENEPSTGRLRRTD